MTTQVADPSPASRLLTTEQTARVLAHSRSAVFELIRRGDLRSTKVGKRRLVFADSIDDYVARLSAQAR